MPDEIKKQEADAKTALAIRAWNMLGARIDWQGLAITCEILGITDIELLISQLEAIRDYEQLKRQYHH